MLARAFLGADQAPSARLWPRQIQCVPPRKRSADDADLLVRRLGCALGINHRSRISAEQGCCFGGSLLTAYIALAGIFTNAFARSRRAGDRSDANRFAVSCVLALGSCPWRGRGGGWVGSRQRICLTSRRPRYGRRR
jgi:hypothetical protein